MARGYDPVLRSLVEAAAPRARVIVEARVEQGADIRQSPGTAEGSPLGWTDAANWATVGSGLEILSDGSIRLKAVNGTIIGPTTVNAYHQAYQTLVGAPYTDPFFYAPIILPTNATFAAVGITAQGLAGLNKSYGSLEAYVNPQVSLSQAISVKTWLMRLWLVVHSPNGEFTALQNLIQVAVTAPSNVAGWVTFPFQMNQLSNLHYFRPQMWDPHLNTGLYLVTVSGVDAHGASAPNSGWGYDNTTQVLVVGASNNGTTFQGVSIGPFAPNNTPLTLNQNLPALQLIPASYPNGAVTLTFSTTSPIAGSPINATAPSTSGINPTTPPQFTLQDDVPQVPGCAVTATIAAHGTADTPVAIDDGENTAQAGSAHPLNQFWDVSVTLTPSSDQTATPILRAVGLRTAEVADLGDLVRISSWTERVDPLTHVSEVGQCTLEVLRDGERDYQDVITQIIANNPLGNLYFRVWIGDRRLPRNQWMHKNDFLVDDHDPRSSNINLMLVSPLALLRADLPTLRADTPSYPSGEDQNPGGFTVVGAPVGEGHIALADLAVGGPYGNPIDQTYIQVVNPNGAAYSCKLSAVSPPLTPLANLVFIQARAALAAVGNIVLQIELWEGLPQAPGGPTRGGTRRAFSAITIGTVDAGEGSYGPWQYGLTASEVASIGDWTNLYLQFIASPGSPSTGTMRIGWARVVETGTRPPLTYPSAATPASTISTCVQDLLQNQIGLDGRFNGVYVPDGSPAIPVTKVIVPRAGGNTDLTRAAQELHALMKIGGSCLIASQGAVKAKALYVQTTGFDPIWGQVTFTASPLVAPVRAIFPLGEVVPLSVSPGWRQRVPIFDVPYGYQVGVYADTPTRASGQAQYVGEQRGLNAYVLDTVPAALIDTERRETDVVAQWIGTQSLANGLAVRHVQAFGAGMMEWRWRTTRPQPQLEIGDLVVVATTDFVAYDPVANRALFGQQYATAVIVACWDAEGTEFSGWIQSPGMILRAIATTHAPTYVIPTGDLVLNPGFEQGLTYWGQWTLAGSTMSLATTSPAPLKGSASLHVGVGSSQSGFVFQKNDPTNNTADNHLAPPLLIPVRPGQVLQLAGICYDNGSATDERVVGLTLLYAGQTLPSAPSFANILVWNTGTNTAIAQKGYYTIPNTVPTPGGGTAPPAYVVVTIRSDNLDGLAPDAYFDEIHLEFVGPGDVGSF